MNKKIYNEDLTLNLILNGDKLQPGNKKLLTELYQLDDATRKLQLRNAQLELEKRKLNTTSANYAQQLARIETEMRRNNSAIDGYHARMQALRMQIGITGLTINQLNTHLRVLQTTLRNATSPATIAQLQAQIAQVQVRIQMLTTGASRLSIAWSNFARTMNKYSAAVGWISMAVYAVGNAIGKLISRNSELDRSLSNVMKTTRLTREEMYRLKRSFDAAATPTKTDDLLLMAGIAGKLGIDGYENIKKFTGAIDILNIALKSDLDMSVEEVASSVGKLVNAFRVTDKMPIDEALLRTGSLLNELDKSSVASAGTILHYMTRLSSLGTTANYPMEKLAGLAAAMETVNIPAERGATALMNIISGLGKYSEKFSRILGMSLEDYKKAVDTDINGVFLKLIELTSKGDKSIIDMTESMGTFELSGVRVRETYSAIAKNLDVIKLQQDIATEAFKSSASVMGEYNIIAKDFMGTIDSQKKRVTALTDEFNIGLQPATLRIYKMWVDFLYVLRDLGQSLYVHQRQIYGLVTAYATWKVVSNITYIVAWGKAWGWYLIASTKQLWINTVAAIANNAALLALQRHGMAGLIVMIRQLWVALKANPWGAIIGGIAAVIGGIAAAFMFLSGKVNLVIESINELRKAAEEQQKALDAIFNAAANSAKGTDKHRAAIKAINDEYGKYLPKLLTESDGLYEIARARNLVIAAIREEISLKFKNDQFAKIQEENAERKSKLTQRLLRGLEGDQLGVTARGLDDLTYKILNTKNLTNNAIATLEKKFIEEFGLHSSIAGNMREYVRLIIEIQKQADELDKTIEGYQRGKQKGAASKIGYGLDPNIPGERPEYVLPGTGVGKDNAFSILRDKKDKGVTEAEYELEKKGIERSKKERLVALNNSKKTDVEFKADSLKLELNYTNDLLALEEKYAAQDSATLEDLRVKKSEIMKEMRDAGIKIKEDEAEQAEKDNKIREAQIKEQIKADVEAESDKFDRMQAEKKLAFTRGEMDEALYNQQILGLELAKWESIRRIQDNAKVDSSETQQKIADAELAIRKNNIKVVEDAAETWYADEKLRIEREYGGKIDQKETYDRQLIIAELAYQSALLEIRKTAGENTTDIELKLFELRKGLMDDSIKTAEMSEKELTKIYGKKTGFISKYIALSKEIKNVEKDGTKTVKEKKVAVDVLTKAQEGLTTAEIYRASVAIANDIDSANSAQEATTAVLNGIRSRIQAYLSEAIAAAIAKEARKGIIGLATSVIAAAGFALLFNSLVPKFSVNSQTGGVQAKTMSWKKTKQAAGGLYPVIGESDGQLYNASYGGGAKTGVYGQPTLLVAEKGPEMVVDYPTLRNMQMNAPGMINAIMAMRVPQYANGKYTTARGDDYTTAQGNDNTTARGNDNTRAREDKILNAIDRLNAHLDNGIPAYINKYGTNGVDDTMKQIANFKTKIGKK